MNEKILVKSSRLKLLAACILPGSLMLQSPAWAYTVTADTQFTRVNSTYSATGHGVGVAPATILPGASGTASSYSGGFANDYFDFSWTAVVVQEYGAFHAQAYTQAHRDSPGKDYEAFQNYASGTFAQTLTIDAPIGISNGSTGSMMLGWDITGNASATGSAYLGILARTSAAVANTNSYTATITNNGHYDLFDPIAFTYGTPFRLTIDSYVQANVGYDYRYTAAPLSFSETASANFLHTAIMSSVTVNDSTGAALAGYTIVTDSGRPFLPVPEPEAYAMWLAGLGLMGAIARREKRNS